jgi:hypothetical protein
MPYAPYIHNGNVRVRLCAFANACVHMRVSDCVHPCVHYDDGALSAQACCTVLPRLHTEL